MNIVELLDKLWVIPDVEVVVALLPEMIGVSDQTSRDTLLQRFQCVGERELLGPVEAVGTPTQAKTRLEWATVELRVDAIELRFAEKKVNMLRHHNICVDAKAKVASHAFKGVLKDSSARFGGEQGTAMITAKSYEVTLPGVVITLEAPRHNFSVDR